MLGKRKKDPSKMALGSPETEGQGTTTAETGSRMEPSSRKKQKRP
ncbi:YuzL family protein [Neobacillus muris]|nr:YuzL family protein [Neobacillus muris]